MFFKIVHSYEQYQKTSISRNIVSKGCDQECVFSFYIKFFET